MPNASDFNRFSVNPVNLDMNRSMFDMDHEVKFSFDVGQVIPFDVIEILPGDTFQIETSKVIRLQPLVAPIMSEIVLDVYWFFVPNRLVWSHWKEFMGENNASAWSPTVEYIPPVLYAPEYEADHYNGAHNWRTGTIADYMGIPVGVVKPTGETVYRGLGFGPSALPFRAYALICNDWFRSEAVMDPVHVFVDDVDRDGSNGSDQVTDIELGGSPFIACKFFDYFTSCLPSPQRGDPVTIRPLRDVSLVPVNAYKNKTNISVGDSTTKYDPIKYLNATGSTFANPSAQMTQVTVSGNLIGKGTAVTSGSSEFLSPSNLFADLTSTSYNFISINDLRSAFAIQRYLEKQARFGGRYIEFIKGFFGVDSPDARLQRSEYLGGSRCVLNINQVEQTSATQNNSTPLGNVAGMSVTADKNEDFLHSFTEHGFVIGCAVARYHHSYQDSVQKLWLRRDKFEWYNPTFANLGEQAVVKTQLYGYSNQYHPEYPSQVFGYNEAWCEYRTLPSRIAGEMRSTYATPLDMWHLGDHYSGVPTLSPEWLREDKSNLDRCLAVTSDVSNQIIADFFVKTKATRVMPTFSIPGLIDHH